MWNEIRTLHFEGQNAILLALKVLSNKIDQGVNQPRSIQVFCYSKHYNRTLRNLVSVLVNRCISIQLGDSRPTTHSRLRVAGKNWQFFFEEKGISLQPIVKIRIKWCNGILIIRNFINCIRQKVACVLCRSNLKAKGLANSSIKTSIV